MILDYLEQLENYAGMHVQWQEACTFLRRPDLEQLEDGKYEIAGEKLFAVVARMDGRQRAEAPLEGHRRYLDIQVPFNTTEEMGWRARSACAEPTDEYDADKDLEFFADMPEFWMTVQPGRFAVFFPGDAHAPAVAQGPLHKVVVKIALA